MIGRICAACIAWIWSRLSSTHFPAQRLQFRQAHKGIVPLLAVLNLVRRRDEAQLGTHDLRLGLTVVAPL
jgi:hypothetical protein